MIDGVKIEDWDFIFTPDDPVCEIKLNNLIDLYFENAEITKYAAFDIFDILEGYRDFSYLKTHVRRKDIYDATWLIYIPLKGGGPSEVFNVGDFMLKTWYINAQYHVFVNMFDTLGITKDLEEVFDKKENGQLKKLMPYYLYGMFLNIYLIQLDRTIKGGLIKLFADVSGVHINNSTKQVVRELLEENEAKRKRGIYER